MLEGCLLSKLLSIIVWRQEFWIRSSLSQLDFEIWDPRASLVYMIESQIYSWRICILVIRKRGF